MLKTKEFLLDLFFPKLCLGCQKEGLYLCDDCRALLDVSEYNYCLCDSKPIRLPPSPPHQSFKETSGVEASQKSGKNHITHSALGRAGFTPPN